MELGFFGLEQGQAREALGHEPGGHLIAHALGGLGAERAVAAEREACAKLCESFSSYEAHDCAAAIRARGEK